MSCGQALFAPRCRFEGLSHVQCTVCALLWRPVGRAAPLSWWWPWSDVLSSRLVDSAVVFQ